jgi:hypothetical protein
MRLSHGVPALSNSGAPAAAGPSSSVLTGSAGTTAAVKPPVADVVTCTVAGNAVGRLFTNSATEEYNSSSVSALTAKEYRGMVWIVSVGCRWVKGVNEA